MRFEVVAGWMIWWGLLGRGRRYGAYVYLDEAHSIGAVGDSGRGVCQELGVDTSLVDVMMGTFTKSFGAAGGYVAGSRALVEELRRHSAGCTDAVSMPPAVCVQVRVREQEARTCCRERRPRGGG